MSAGHNPFGGGTVAVTRQGLPAATGRRRAEGREHPLTASLLLAPAVILVVVLLLAPVAYAVVIGFTNIQLVGPNAVNYRFTGLGNLWQMLRDREIPRSLWLTAIFVLGSGTVGATMVALALALACQKASDRLANAVTSLTIIASILPPVTTALVWRAATSANGTLSFLTARGTELIVHWPMTVISLANAWASLGVAMVMFGAALRNLPADIYEAAEIEGATARQTFLRLTLPLMAPTIASVALLMTILSFGNVTLVWLLTGGGPAGATNILPVYAYQVGFRFYQLGYGAFLGNAMILLVLALVLLIAGVMALRRRRAKEAP